MRVLLIEDDKLMVRAVTMMLSGVGVEYETVTEGEAAIELARLYDYDAILLDLTLPDVHGYEVLRRLRLARIATPVMILSGDSEIATKVSGFGFGAVDYVTKPFQRDELVARLHARVVTVDNHRVALTGKEYSILELLSLRKGMTLTKEMFLTHLYGGRDEPELKIIDVFVCKLRKKLATAGDGAATCIETVWGRGYALRDPEVPGEAIKVA